MTSVSWYQEVADASVEQGDIFRDYPIFVPELTLEHLDQVAKGELPEVPVSILTTDAIVLSQSCDLANNKIDSVTLCPVWGMKKFEGAMLVNLSDKEKSNRKEQIRQGKEPPFHMLAGDEVLNMELSIVEFGRLYTTPKDFINKFADNCDTRLRLISPYREHLSQSFARYFMRVGLPSDIRPFR